MTSMDAYLAKASRALAGMDPRVREDILRELRSHLADAATAEGEEAALAAEPPEGVAARYREMYGYGIAYRVLFVAMAVVLAVPTWPVLVYAGIGVPAALAGALAFLLVLVAYLMFVGVRAGSQTGAVAGLAACVARIVAVVAFDAPAAYVVPDAIGWVTFLSVSVGLIALGFLPGRAKEKWKPRDVTM